MKLLPFYLQNNKKRKILFFRQKGFTLVEVIVALVIIGILAAFMSTGIARIIEGYFFTRDNTDTALEGQVALTRVVKEFRSIDGVDKGNKTSITYSYNRDGKSIPGRTLSWSGAASSPLLLGGNTLVNNVSDFKITYHTKFNDPGDNTWNGNEQLISITLKLKGASDQVSSFSTRIVPRNL